MGRSTGICWAPSRCPVLRLVLNRRKEDTGLSRSTHTLHQEEVGQGIRRSCSSQMRGSDSVYPKDPQVLASICLPTLKCQHSSQTPKALVSVMLLHAPVSLLLLWLLPRSPCPKLSFPLHFCKLSEAFPRMPSSLYHPLCLLYFYQFSVQLNHMKLLFCRLKVVK